MSINNLITPSFEFLDDIENYRYGENQLPIHLKPDKPIYNFPASVVKGTLLMLAEPSESFNEAFNEAYPQLISDEIDANLIKKWSKCIVDVKGIQFSPWLKMDITTPVIAALHIYQIIQQRESKEQATKAAKLSPKSQAKVEKEALKKVNSKAWDDYVSACQMRKQHIEDHKANWRAILKEEKQVKAQFAARKAAAKQAIAEAEAEPMPERPARF